MYFLDNFFAKCIPCIKDGAKPGPSMNEIKSIFPGIDQIIIYLVAVIVLLVRPRGLLGREGVMED